MGLTVRRKPRISANSRCQKYRIKMHICSRSLKYPTCSGASQLRALRAAPQIPIACVTRCKIAKALSVDNKSRSEIRTFHSSPVHHAICRCPLREKHFNFTDSDAHTDSIFIIRNALIYIYFASKIKKRKKKIAHSYRATTNSCY